METHKRQINNNNKISIAHSISFSCVLRKKIRLTDENEHASCHAEKDCINVKKLFCRNLAFIISRDMG